MCRLDSPSPQDESELQSKTETTNYDAITLKELKRHNTPYDSWCTVHDKVLDITEFAKRHPGGDLILLASGKDATILFETYHPRGVSSSIVDKLVIGKMKEGEIAASFYSWTSPFYSTLRSRVVSRLESLDLPRRGTTSIQIKATVLLSLFWFFIYKMCTSAFYPNACIYSVLMGITASFIGTCIQHDGNHGAFSTRRFWNKMAGWTLDMIGASAFTWELQHMLGHHPYTNLLDAEEEEKKDLGIDCPMHEKDQESDPDVFSSYPLLRMHPLHKPQHYTKYQHLYAPILFAFMTLAKVFQQDFEVITQRRLYHIDAECRYASLFNRVRFWFMKVLTLGYMVVLPCYFHGVLRGLALFLIGHFSCGELLATMFIVNHVIDGVAFAQKGQVLSTNTKQQKVPLNDWAAVQCQTSVNWSPGSTFWNHFSGGLSHQIEHHLFPSICHTNYVYIQDVVQSTCEEFGVPYNSEPNLLVAYQKMILHLYKIGNGEDLKKVD